METLPYGLFALCAAALCTLGGLGGALLLVPALVLLGLSPGEAAPLGLLTVASSSIAAAPRQLEERLVNHRIGTTVELVAATGAVVGANLSGLASDKLLTYILAAAAATAALAGVGRKGLRNLPDPECVPADIGERVGGLGGAYPLGDEIVPYRVRRLRNGMVAMAVAGMVAGTAGVSGGFIKTPAMSEILTVPTKVASATTTYTVGITSSAALVVYAVQGRLDPDASLFVIAGSLLGGLAGARLQAALHPQRVRTALAALLLTTAVILVVRA
ncbi:MAG: sulfite exporter TauE/SafE family protein [Acidimicrobiales bacterium]